MFLGALVDAGVPLDHLSEVTESLAVGARLEARTVVRGGITGTKVDVIAPETGVAHTHEPAQQSHSREHHDYDHGDAHHSHDHGHAHSHAHSDEHSHEHSSASHSQPAHRSLNAILKIIDAARLHSAVKERAARAFRLLGDAEAAVHSIPVEQVHFHEVGAVDTIVDIVCAAAGAAYLGVDRWVASPLNVGSGTVHCAHGTLPVPAPATVRLLSSAPVYAAGPAMERVTPTGAAILRMLDVAYAPLPSIRIQSSGYGAGGQDTQGQPNLLRMMVGESDALAGEPEPGTEPIAILETVIDDSSPQLLAYVSELLLEAGAWDVYRIPVQMKKGRTGVQMTVLCAPDHVSDLRDILFRETTTIGAHWRIENKLALRREFAEVDTVWGKVRMKIARSASGEVLNASPEYEDCRRIAAGAEVPLKQVMQAAVQAWWSDGGKCS